MTLLVRERQNDLQYVNQPWNWICDQKKNVFRAPPSLEKAGVKRQGMIRIIKGQS